MANNLPTSIKNLNTLLGNQLAEGGGGGSSDFSTATVTIVNNSSSSTSGTGGCPTVYEANALVEGTPAMIFDLPPSVSAGDTKTVLAPLYKGACFWLLEFGFGSGYFYQVSGSVTDPGGNKAIITGNCTVTIADQF